MASWFFILSSKLFPEIVRHFDTYMSNNLIQIHKFFTQIFFLPFPTKETFNLKILIIFTYLFRL